MASEITEIGHRLRLIREAKRLNQASFCRLVQIEQQAWNNYEGGRRRISLDQALKVCNITGATLEFIYRARRESMPADLLLAIQEIERAEARR